MPLLNITHTLLAVGARGARRLLGSAAIELRRTESTIEVMLGVDQYSAAVANVRHDGYWRGSSSEPIPHSGDRRREPSDDTRFAMTRRLAIAR